MSKSEDMVPFSFRIVSLASYLTLTFALTYASTPFAKAEADAFGNPDRQDCLGLVTKRFYAGAPPLTDPRRHDPKKFTLIVYATDFTSVSDWNKVMDAKLFRKSSDGLFKRVGSQKLISVSVIDEKKPYAFAAYGVTISPPSDAAVLASGWKDLASPRKIGRSTMENIRLSYPKDQYPLGTVLEKSGIGPGNHNEILLDEQAWKSAGGEITGIFYKVSATDGEVLVSPELFEELKRVAGERDLPLIAIPQETKDLPDRALRIKASEFDPRAFLTETVDGTRYELELVATRGKPEFYFSAFRKEGDLLVVSDQEHLDFFVNRLAERAVSDSRLRKILEWSGIEKKVRRRK